MTLNGTKSAVALLLIQTAIALSVAGKYALDRATKPRVWVRAQQYDPATPLRGRYLALQLTVDACSLKEKDATSSSPGSPIQHRPFRSGEYRRTQTWPVTLLAQNGKLMATAAADPSPGTAQAASLTYGDACTAAYLDGSVDFFLPEHAASPLPTSRDAALWVEVTVPSTGPPRPIQLAVSDKSGWHVLKQ